MRRYSISLDISTTNLGLAIWDDLGQLVEVRHLIIKNDKDVPEEDRYLDKAKHFREYIVNFKKEVEGLYDCIIENIFVEQPLMNTLVNIVTTAKLLAFNGIVCYILDDVFKRSPFLISVYQSRKLFFPEYVITKTNRKGEKKETLSLPKKPDKKDLVQQKVAKLYPEIKWHYKANGKIKETSYDMSDSVVVGLAGLKVFGILK